MALFCHPRPTKHPGLPPCLPLSSPLDPRICSKVSVLLSLPLTLGSDQCVLYQGQRPYFSANLLLTRAVRKSVCGFLRIRHFRSPFVYDIAPTSHSSCCWPSTGHTKEVFLSCPPPRHPGPFLACPTSWSARNPYKEPKQASYSI